MVHEKVSGISAFDLDGTLFSGNSSFNFCLYLYSHRLCSTFALIPVFFAYGMFKIGFFSPVNIHQIAFRCIFKGQSEPFIIEHVERFLNEDFDGKLYQPAIEKLRKAQSDGHITLILSSSPDFIVKAVAERLAVPLWASTKYAVDKERRFCHIIHIMEGEDKALFMLRMQEQYGSAIDTTAYSDSAIDLPFLQSAGNAVGVKPERTLMALCKRYDWPVI